MAEEEGAVKEAAQREATVARQTLASTPDGYRWISPTMHFVVSCWMHLIALLYFKRRFGAFCLQVWLWGTALLYLCVRTKWRLDRRQHQRALEKEAQVEQLQEQEWQG